jgi:outer membrane protein OmpA-like peptidoglycan-associated protein
MTLAVLLLAAVGSKATVQQNSDSSRLPRLAIKTNLLYGATATPNLGLEYRTGKRMSLALSAGYNPWTFDDSRKIKHYMLQGEYRYWLKEAFNGHFAGLHGLYSRYNVGGIDVPLLFKKEYRYDGSAYGAGISYGYHLALGNRWGLEFNIGAGYAHLSHGKYLCGNCGKQVSEETVQYFGPTRAGISIAYRIGQTAKPVRSVTPDDLLPEITKPELAARQPEAENEPAVTGKENAIEKAIVDSFENRAASGDKLAENQAAAKDKDKPAEEPAVTTGDKLAETHPYVVKLSANALEHILESNSEHLLLADTNTGKNSLDIRFPQGSFRVNPDFADNYEELEKIIRSIRDIEASSDSRVTAVFIAGYASPEGSAAINKTLADRRAKALKEYISKRTRFGDIRFITYNGELNYRELRTLVAASSMPYRDRVLDIIDNTPIWDSRRNMGRRGELMKLAGGEPYRYMYRNFFPKLRVAAYIKVLFDDKKKNEDLKDLKK